MNCRWGDPVGASGPARRLRSGAGRVIEAEEVNGPAIAPDTSSRLSPEARRSNQGDRQLATLTRRRTATNAKQANTVGQNGDAPTTARLSTEPGRTAMQASNGRR